MERINRVLHSPGYYHTFPYKLASMWRCHDSASLISTNSGVVMLGSRALWCVQDRHTRFKRSAQSNVSLWYKRFHFQHAHYQCDFVSCQTYMALEVCMHHRHSGLFLLLCNCKWVLGNVTSLKNNKIKRPENRRTYLGLLCCSWDSC